MKRAGLKPFTNELRGLRCDYPPWAAQLGICDQIARWGNFPQNLFVVVAHNSKVKQTSEIYSYSQGKTVKEHYKNVILKYLIVSEFPFCACLGLFYTAFQALLIKYVFIPIGKKWDKSVNKVFQGDKPREAQCWQKRTLSKFPKKKINFSNAFP